MSSTCPPSPLHTQRLQRTKTQQGYQTPLTRLNVHYEAVTKIILSKQNPVTGLIPASVAVTVHGDYRDAWVRDNVYSILAVYGLALAYRRIDDDLGRGIELENSSIKLMRGLLGAMMKQTQKVELFKNTQSPADALHAKYNTQTGETVVGDKEWGHLQVDATSIFLLMLAQMTVSGMICIFSLDEVAFIQNLVYYIERAYRTPDYGIWERGNKMNHGLPELNSSSIGMAVAALQAISELNVFGPRGGPSSMIHVLPDELTRNYNTLLSALPRESNSKEIDAAILSVISYPAFAVADQKCVTKTRSQIIAKLAGKYGCKRFLRDGHQAEVENTSRLHYEPSELKIFEHIECEWPLFFTYLILDGLFRGDFEQVEHYRELLKPLLVDSNELKQKLLRERSETSNESLDAVIATIPDDAKLVPEVYIVPQHKCAAEKENPRSQDRYPNENIPLVWAQSLYILGELMYDNLLSPAEIDPLARHSVLTKRSLHRDVVVQVSLIAEDAELQSRLAMYGLETQTPQQVASIKVSHPSFLRDAYRYLGVNTKLGLTGRPSRPLGTLATCKLYRVGGQIYSFTPHFMDGEEFYLNLDNDFLVTLLEHELRFIKNNWLSSGRPTMTIMLTHAMMDSLALPTRGSGYVPTPDNKSLMGVSKSGLLDLMMSLRSGYCGGVRVRLGRLQEMISTSCVQSLEFLNVGNLDFESILGQGDRKTAKDAWLQASNQKKTTSRSIKKDSKAAGASPLLSPIGGTDDHDYRHTTPLSAHTGGQFGRLFDAGHIPDPFKGSKPQLPELSLDNTRRLSLNEPAAPDCLPLCFGDHSNIQPAIEMLNKSSNINDQADVLHYLVSCKGLDMEVPISTHGKASVKTLLEEVYHNAARLRKWDIVRQTAGILKKVVNSLTINLSDLVIRQKQVTVGTGASEYVVSAPMTPSKLSSVIFQHCDADVREAPLVQEILTYLGSFLRAEPHLFDGILRVRTHYIILAMREEISRLRDCCKEDAIDFLMQLSPSEMKALLGLILSAKYDTSKHTWSRGHSIATSPGFDDKVDSRAIVMNVQSGGFSDGNFSRIEVNGQIISVGERGLNVVVIDPRDGKFLDVTTYDTHTSEADSNDLAEFIHNLPSEVIVCMAGKDEFSECLTSSARSAIELLGSNFIQKVAYRDSWAIIGVKDAPAGSVMEQHRESKNGPTEVLQKTIRSLEKDENAAEVASEWGLNNGRWARRRRIDGALQRSPRFFYPKVHRLLENCGSIYIHPHSLPRDPTVSEKTPEEINFAIQVESIFNGVSNPAERQIAVECIMIISKLQERNPEMKFTSHGGVIDILKIVNEAYVLFWSEWSQDAGKRALATYLVKCFTDAKNASVSPERLHESHSHERLILKGLPLPIINQAGFISSCFIANPQLGPKIQQLCEQKDRSKEDRVKEAMEHVDLSYGKCERAARRLFHDLAPGGVNGSTAYLIKTALRTLPYDIQPVWDEGATGSAHRLNRPDLRLDIYGSQGLASELTSEEEEGNEGEQDRNCAIQ